jgi:hypothetical protein
MTNHPSLVIPRLHKLEDRLVSGLVMLKVKLSDVPASTKRQQANPITTKSIISSLIINVKGELAWLFDYLYIHLIHDA